LEAGRGTFPVAQKGRNELDLCDMNGNVCEWCWDLHGSTRRSIRYGSWNNSAGYNNVSVRGHNAPDRRDFGYGLRLARSL
jgi:formylglycine-generating enzyme required for sulfatase activity